VHFVVSIWLQLFNDAVEYSLPATVDILLHNHYITSDYSETSENG
jgi:hypothetical protein